VPFAGHRLVGSSRSFRTSRKGGSHQREAERLETSSMQQGCPEIRPWHRNLRKWGEATDGQGEGGGEPGDAHQRLSAHPLLTLLARLWVSSMQTFVSIRGRSS
jgi:hypothetical protein